MNVALAQCPIADLGRSLSFINVMRTEALAGYIDLAMLVRGSITFRSDPTDGS